MHTHKYILQAFMFGENERNGERGLVPLNFVKRLSEYAVGAVVEPEY